MKFFIFIFRPRVSVSGSYSHRQRVAPNPWAESSRAELSNWCGCLTCSIELKIINNNNLLHDKNSIKDAKCIDRLLAGQEGGVALGPLRKKSWETTKEGKPRLTFISFLKHFSGLIVDDDFLRFFPSVCSVCVYISRLSPRGRETHKIKSRKSTTRNNGSAVDYWNHCVDVESLTFRSFAARHFGISWHPALSVAVSSVQCSVFSCFSVPDLSRSQSTSTSTRDGDRVGRLWSVELLSWQTSWQRQMLCVSLCPRGGNS